MAFFSNCYESVANLSSRLLSASSIGSKRSSSSSGGQTRGFLRSWTQRLFLAAVVIEAIFLVVNAAFLLRNQWWRYHLETFVRVTFAVMPSMVILTVDAFRSSNIIEVAAVSLFNLPLLVYHIIQRVQAEDAYFLHTTNPSGLPCPPEIVNEPQCAGFRKGWDEWIVMLTAAPVLIAVCQLLYAYWTWLLAAEFGWNHFRLLGGDVQLKRFHNWEQRLTTLLKVDFFFFAIFAIYNTIFSAQALGNSSLSLATHVAVVITLILQYLLLLAPLGGLFSMRNEWNLSMHLVLAFLFLGSGALITLTWTFVYVPRLEWDWYTRTMRGFLIVLSTIDATLVFITTALGSYLVFTQFGRGLLEAKQRGQAKVVHHRHDGAGKRPSGFSLVGMQRTESDESSDDVLPAPGRMVIE